VILQIENSTICNAHCFWCPWTIHKRTHTTMEFDLFKKIVDEAATIPRIERITITGLGEPTLDPGLWDKIAYAKKTMYPNIELDVYTNGSTLDLEMVNRFKKSGLGCLYVSLNAISRTKRREIMGLDDYDRLEPILLKAIGELNGKMRINITAVDEKDLFDGYETEMFLDKWGGSFDKPGGHSFLHLEGNWAGWNYKVRTTQANICERSISNVMVLVDGRVSLCCQDYNGEYIFGDLNDETIRDIYQKEEYVHYRQLTSEGRRSELNPCKDCTTI
jgi:radical SAM protein with 4Fe4S-binding SPASM domain